MEKAGYEKTDYPGVYKRTARNGKEQFYIYYRNPEGKRRFEKAVIPRVNMTAKKAADLRSAKSTGNILSNAERREAERRAKAAEAGRWTIDKLWTAWKEDPENQGKRGTFKADQRYRKHLKGLFGDREPKDIVQTDIDRLRLSLAKSHAKATTVSVLGLLHRIINYGFIKGHSPALSFPIVLKGKKLGKDPRIKRAPTDAEVAAYVKVCREWPDPQAGNFQLLMVYTGIRRGSVRNLRWEDISLENATAILKNSKTGTISIPLSKNAVELLRNHPHVKDDKGDDIPYVFAGTGPGGCRSDRQIDRIPAQIRDAAGLPKDLDPCHMFRRNLATKLDKHGATTKTIMLAGGWKTAAMVHHYTATEKETVRDAVDILAESIQAAEAAEQAKKAEGENR